MDIAIKIILIILLCIIFIPSFLILSDVHSLLGIKIKETQWKMKDKIKTKNIERLVILVRQNVSNLSTDKGVFYKNMIQRINETYIAVDRCLDKGLREWLNDSLKDPELYIKFIIEKEIKEYNYTLVSNLAHKEMQAALRGETFEEDEN